MPKVFAIVPAAGQGTRMGDAVPKQYIPLAGKPLMFHALEALAAVRRIDTVCVVLSPFDRHWKEHDWSALPDKVEPCFAGGEFRAQTVANGLRHLASRIDDDDWVLVHDAARPCVRSELVEQFLDEVDDDPVGGLLAVPLADSLKRSDEALRVAATIPRLDLWRAQTPQMFRHDLLARGLDAKPDATDESQAVEAIGYSRPRLIQGDNTNIKVTFAEDLFLAEMILRRQGRVAA
ncbi:MAG TPA: 2-C-methyl-D-erythritol 4-phosphate cytidylyltransferase [Usitatibacter sp.]|jgi:2-C-methyl-D-erythritol 4-phosphate cytidylyltransferase|nr:2-C-methyl-D-erythritol 4-phosphate cytidylyltransferase [Usitatibacter sp.]